jgi:hypothetical protein
MHTGNKKLIEKLVNKNIIEKVANALGVNCPLPETLNLMAEKGCLKLPDENHKYEKLCIDLRGFSDKKKKEVQDAFFTLGYTWRGTIDEDYPYLDNVALYMTVPNINMTEEPSGQLFFSRRPNHGDDYTPYLISYDALMNKAYGGFGKSSLQDLDVIVLRSGLKLEVHFTVMIHMRNNGFNKYGFSTFVENTVVSLDYYDEELRNIEDPAGDIIKVYRDGVEMFNREEKEEDGKAKRLAKIEELKRTIRELEDMS